MLWVYCRRLCWNIKPDEATGSERRICRRGRGRDINGSEGLKMIAKPKCEAVNSFFELLLAGKTQIGVGM